jgi:hypothetical protein
VQVNISFNTVSKYKPGLKILLLDSIYPAAASVSFDKSPPSNEILLLTNLVTKLCCFFAGT